jgi:hypothetical protein
MRLRGHFIGALTLAFIAGACASATLIQPAPGAPWTRLEGFATADQLLAEPSNLSRLHTVR